MKATLGDIASQALLLPQKSRAFLASRLLHSLGKPGKTKSEESWVKVARKRDGEISEGRVTCLTTEEVMQKARVSTHE